MPIYKINSPCMIAGTIHKSGTVECDESSASALLSSGSLSPLNDGSEVNAEVKQTSQPSFEGLSLNEAIAALPGDDKNWTASGAPQIKALEALTGTNISAAERDEAWDAYQNAALLEANEKGAAE